MPRQICRRNRELPSFRSREKQLQLLENLASPAALHLGDQASSRSKLLLLLSHFLIFIFQAFSSSLIIAASNDRARPNHELPSFVYRTGAKIATRIHTTMRMIQHCLCERGKGRGGEESTTRTQHLHQRREEKRKTTDANHCDTLTVPAVLSSGPQPPI